MMKPFTAPDHCTDQELITCYWNLCSRDIRWLAGLRREDGSLYLERPATDYRHYTQSFQAQSDRTERELHIV